MSSEQIFDIFCSYDSHSSGSIVLEASQKLISKNWDVIVDRYQKLYMNDSKKDINRSKIFLCFFTTNYCSQITCLQKLEYAKKMNKRIIIIVLEKANLANLAKNFRTIIENSPKVIAYDQPNNLRAWFDVLFDQIRTEIDIIDQMNTKLKQKYFRATTIKQIKHDMFISFEDETQDIVHSICEELTKKDFKIWVDIHHAYRDETNLHVEVEDAILESRMTICFMTRKYCLTQNGQQELKFAFTNKRKCILVLLENFDLGQAGFGMYVLGTLKCNAYEEPNCLEYWSETLFEKLNGLIRKSYCQLYVKEDLKEIDENNELTNIYRKFRRIVLDCAILREKSNKLRVDCNKKTSLGTFALTERQELAIETYLKSLENQNKAILTHKKYVESVYKRFEDKQKLIIEKFRVYKYEFRRFSTSKSSSTIDDKKRLKIITQELINLFERMKFTIREELLLLDELNYNYNECDKLNQIKDINYVNNVFEFKKICIESDVLFKMFRAVLEKQTTLTDDMKLPDFEAITAQNTATTSAAAAAKV